MDGPVANLSGLLGQRRQVPPGSRSVCRSDRWSERSYRRRSRDSHVGRDDRFDPCCEKALRPLLVPSPARLRMLPSKPPSAWNAVGWPRIRYLY